ncbi:MAG: hypothetical protein J6Q61_04135 [Bacteroidales bacterium]|nr:hypothetical protein [Bacteroidales bacterium]
MNIRYQFFSKDKDVTQELMDIIKIFVKHSDEFNSYNKELCSNEVLSCISNDLKQLGYKIKETRNGPDAINKQHKIIVEVEAGRALTNNQFLRNLIETCLIDNVEYLVLAVRNIYKKQHDYDKIVEFLSRLYASSKLILPLKGVLVLGY